VTFDYDLFVSYQSADRGFALELAGAVEKESYQGRQLKVFIDQWDIRPGEDIVGRIELALGSSRFVGLVLSPDYLRADWPTAEKNAAIFTDPSGRLGFVIPLMFRKCTLPPLLTFRKYIDFTEGNLKRGLPRLLAILKNEPLARGDQAGQILSASTSDTEIATRLLSSAFPDEVPEPLYSNLFRITKLPSKIWSEPMQFRGLRDLHVYFEGRIVPPHLIWEKRLYTFANLASASHPFLGVVEQFDIRSDPTEGWLADGEGTHRLVWLLNDCIRARTAELRMSFDKSGRKYFFDEGVLKDTNLLPYGKGRPKGLLFDYTALTPPRGYKAFRALKARFLVLSRTAFLQLESGWVFKNAANQFLGGRRAIALSVRFTSSQKNSTNLSEVRFWAWLLSTEKDRIAFDTTGDPLEVDARPTTAIVPVGVYGDQVKLRPIVEPPELAFDEPARRGPGMLPEDEGDEDELDDT